MSLELTIQFWNWNNGRWENAHPWKFEDFPANLQKELIEGKTVVFMIVEYRLRHIQDCPACQGKGKIKFFGGIEFGCAMCKGFGKLEFPSCKPYRGGNEK